MVPRRKHRLDVDDSSRRRELRAYLDWGIPDRGFRVEQDGE
jgi:hypothetical protein